ncbi:tRNA uridine-5-carboxymethylaminomethyl(34) synthesis GTPase MnmE [Candidatus Synechococcus spongiarum LMB bulk15M]|uniref:tRNA modification GTPase MnmE n=1 Tax=Candidatus Synechococcus spongiarum LMB bulk15M TaxID=1943582 RepID=A0A1T1D3M1_9SYNE|nr:tRNA uridine-5-carboxymethylaminomethyl(34) synthesis GTPase MnmE [Candidatus Synechococcus spongiarum LMB bulk15M]
MNRPGSTIAAVATAVAAGVGSVAIVRISGPQAQAVGQRVFRPTGKRQPVWESHRVLYGHVVEPASGQVLDEVLLLYMQAPRSFTGEDVVELHCHGGVVCVQRVLEQVLTNGAEAAAPGAFSQRAFLHGRLDLTQAEAVAQVISARSRRAAGLALAGLDGGIERRIEGLRQQLLEQLAQLEAHLDFEDDLPPLRPEAVKKKIQEVAKNLSHLVKDSLQGQSLQQGLRVAIIGCPNVGKSSLLNYLGGRDRAIVTDLPGTTRDTLETEVVLRDVPITLVDTAGIREASNPVEKLGIARSRQVLKQVDLIILLFDVHLGWSEADQALANELPEDVPHLRVGNKVDLLDQSRYQANGGSNDALKSSLAISSITGQGMEAFTDAFFRCCGLTDLERLDISLNRRQTSMAQKAIEALIRLETTAQAGLPWDFWTIDLRDAIHYLGEITGKEISENILDEIFSKFCIGK